MRAAQDPPLRNQTGGIATHGATPFDHHARRHAWSTPQWRTPSTMARTGTHRRRKAPIAIDTRAQRPTPHERHPTTGLRAAQRGRSLRRAALNSDVRSANTVVMTSRRGITTMSKEDEVLGVSGSPERKISRIRRLAAFLCTAPPRRRDAITPRRSTPCVLGSANKVILRLGTRRPRSCTATNSARERSRTCRPND